MRVMTFSRHYPKYHPKAGEPTYFVEKIWASINDYYFDQYPLAELGDFDPKVHTIRAGNRWKVGDWFQPAIWGDDINPKSGRSGPYQSKQIHFAPPIQVKKIWGFEIKDENALLNGAFQDSYLLNEIAVNDGLDYKDLLQWFRFPKPFAGQIICWDERIEY